MANQCAPGYGVWLNDDGTWYVVRGYRAYDGRLIRDGLPHRYSTRHTAYRASWSDYHRRGDQPGTTTVVGAPQAGEEGGR